jgi:DNA (cytosine-5)-methyltransferase 1
MLHLDLFSGIGGFAYAADQVFGDVEHVFCDNDKFCQQVLKKHWPEAPIYGDIRQFTTYPDNGRQTQQEQQTAGYQQRDRGVDLLTGGFPCQPFSAAGLRRGTSDERHLWPEMLRVIQSFQPEWVIAENVRGLTNWNEGVVFEQVCTDLETSGYEVQPFVIPAVAVNAPHRRDRVWFVAHSTQPDDRGNAGELPQTNELQAKERPKERIAEPSGADKLDASNTGCKRRSEGSHESVRPESQEPKREDGSVSSWERNWTEVAAELCSVDDGLPVELDGFKLSKSQHRKEQLKAYGNAIVPQVAMEIMRAINLTRKDDL